jgi:putative ABC transport system substrate-binding protein
MRRRALLGSLMAMATMAGADAQFRLRQFAADFVAERIDVILAIGSVALHTAYANTRTLPIVGLDLETDPVGSGLVRSLARPGGNVTGIFLDAPEVAGKWFQLPREVLPRIRRFGLLFDSNIDEAQVRAAEAAARDSDAQTVRLPVDHADHLQGAFEKAVGLGTEGLIVHSSPVFVDNAQRIGRLALERRLPSVALFPISAESGGLLSYGPDNFALWPRAGAIAARVAMGAAPEDIPIERPALFKLLVNLRTAKALAIDVPSSRVSIADEVIE